MKVSFVTGSLEPGRTGVGDYTRLLAGACRELGHEVQTIGLNDHFIPSRWEGLQDDIPCLRFPESLTWEYKWQRANPFVDKFDPDWISLQFVPYDIAYEEGFEDMERRVPDTARARELIGFKPEVNLDAIIQSVLDDQRA